MSSALEFDVFAWNDVKDDPKTLGERLRYARCTLNWTQKKLSQKCGLSKHMIGLYENDKNIPNVLTAADLAQSLGVSLGWLVGMTDEMEVQGCQR